MRLLGVLLMLCVAVTAYAEDAPSFADAQALLAEGRADEAQALLTQLVESADADAEAFLYLGSMLRSQGQMEAAREMFEEGTRRDEQHTGLLCEYAMTLAWMNEHEGALRVYERALHSDPAALCAQRGRALVLFWNGDHDEAVAAYEGLVARDPADADALRGLADVHRSRMREDAARRHYNEVLELAPGDERATAGLLHLDELRRWELFAVLGAVHFEGASPIVSGRLGAAWTLTPDTSVRAQYDADVPSVGASGGGGDSVSLAHTATLSVNQRASSWLDLEFGYAVRRQSPATLHRLTLRASAALGGPVRLLGGVRPSIDHAANTALLGDLGVQLQLNSSIWVMGQFYGFTAAAEQDSWSAVCTASVGLGAFELRVVGSAGRRGDAVTAAGAANIEWRVDDTWRVHIGYNIQRGEARRHRAEVGVRVSL